MKWATYIAIMASSGYFDNGSQLGCKGAELRADVYFRLQFI